MESDFQIEVVTMLPLHCEECGVGNDTEVMIKVDLCQPEFEDVVLKAAGRFQSLRRKNRKGGRPRTMIKCIHGRKVWKHGGKKCPKCVREERVKANEEKRSEDSNGVEANGNRPRRNRVGSETGVQKGKSRQEDQHEDHSEEDAEERARINPRQLPEMRD